MKMDPICHVHRRQRGFSLLEIMVVLAILSIIAVISAPLILGGRDKAWEAACDDNEYKLVNSLQNELDTEMNEGNVDAAKTALVNVVAIHDSFKNPRNFQLAAYVLTDDADPACPPAFVLPAATQCQVAFCYQGSDVIVAHQYWVHGPRSFRVTVN